MDDASSATGTRHLGVDVLARNHDGGVPGSFTVTGTPAAGLHIDPARQLIGISVLAHGEHDSEPAGPDLKDLAHLNHAVDHRDGQMWHRLDVTYADNLTEVYAVLCAVLDRVQIDGEDFTPALQAVLSGLGDILTGTGALSRERQVGLFGELTTLLAAVRALGAPTALAAWRGPRREEHDFGLVDVDVEVKTTTAESRVHWIHGSTQLLPTPGRDLLLLSIQITGAGAGPGATLSDLVAAVRTTARLVPAGRQALLEEGLYEAGWHDHHADLYPDRWALRSLPTFHLVDEDFPALTPAGLAAATNAAHRIVGLSYRIDVTDLATTTAPFPLTPTTGALP